MQALARGVGQRRNGGLVGCEQLLGRAATAGRGHFGEQPPAGLPAPVRAQQPPAGQLLGGLVDLRVRSGAIVPDPAAAEAAMMLEPLVSALPRRFTASRRGIKAR